VSRRSGLLPQPALGEEGTQRDPDRRKVAVDEDRFAGADPPQPSGWSKAVVGWAAGRRRRAGAIDGQRLDRSLLVPDEP
jgi:hypothetical protein